MNSPELTSLFERGYAVQRSLVSKLEVAQLLRWIEQFDAEQQPPATMEPEYEISTSGRPRLRKLRRLFWNDPAFWKPALERSGLFELARNLVYKKTTLIFHAAFMKPSSIGSQVGFHQDQALWDYEYPRAISIWVALSSSRVANGCLIGYPGSHKLGLVPHRASGSWHPTIPVSAVDLAKPVFIEMDAGDVAWWHRYFIHGSGPNRSNVDRRGMVLVFANADDKNFCARDKYSLWSKGGL
jgi:hypothetical protein